MDYQNFIDEKIHQLRVLSQTQWDYLKFSDLQDWLDDNFGNDVEGKYYAIKILLHTIYYKKKDIERLIEFGLHDKIYGEIIKQQLILSENIFVPFSETQAKVRKLKDSTFFIPLLDSEKPYESGNLIIGDLVHKIGIKTDQVDFPQKVNEETLKNYKILVFVDDCVGSGSQLKKFWKSDSILKIRSFCEKYSIKMYYLVLIGYLNNLIQLKAKGDVEGLEIVVCDLLTDKNRIFSDDNIIWDRKNNERDLARAYFERIRRERGVSFLGYKKLDFAVILHDRVPNWSLPIFWKNTSGWKHLLQRKTTY